MEKDTKAMAKKELDFMKKKGAPKSMIKHETAEHKAMGYKSGGTVRGTGCATKGKKFKGTY